MRGIIDAAYRRAHDLLMADPTRLHELADGMLKDETLDAAAVRAIFERAPPRAVEADPEAVGFKPPLVGADPEHYELA